MAREIPDETLVDAFITRSNDLMIRLDLAGRITFHNPAVLRRVGADEADLAGHLFVDLVFPAEREATEAAVVDWIARGAAGVTVENRLLDRRTGQAIPVMWSVTRQDEGPERGLILVGRDITTRLIEEEALREREGLFRSLLEFAPDAIVLVDAQGRIRLINRQVERYFGYRRDELLGNAIEILVPERYRKVHVGYRDGYFAHPQVRPMGSGLEPNGQRKDGSEFPIDASLGPVETRHGLMTVAIVRDITERRQAQAELKKRTAALEQAHRELQELDSFKDDFLSVLSHELRTPLNFIQGFASILDDEIAGPLSPEQHAYLKKILMGSDRLLFQINNLVTMSQVLAGKLQLAPTPTDYPELLLSTAEPLRQTIEERGLTLVMDVDPMPEVCLDVEHVAQVIGNLLDNAIKFTPAGGTIRLAASLRGDRLMTQVSDTGVGIAPEDIPKLFMRFRQLDMSATRRAGGMGLGLSVSKVIIERHGGQIDLTSEVGKGSTFRFSLPARRNCAEPLTLG